MTAEVLLEVKHMCLDRTFAYAVPSELAKDVLVGKRVKVAFGKKKVEGFVMSIAHNKKYDFALKNILEVVDEDVVLNQELLKLGEYMKQKTLSPLIYCYQTMLPKGVKAAVKYKIANKKEKYLQINRRKKRKNVSEKGTQVLALFDEKKEIPKKEATNISASAVSTLLKNGLLKEIEKEVREENDFSTINSAYHLTDEQKKCISLIMARAEQFHPFLLHGTTGSGKTEVYLQIIEKILQNDKQIIMLVPEISLTPQIVQLFRERFGNNLAVFHSGLTDLEKYREYLKIKHGKVKIVVGARSAIFVPFDNIGAIIVDEEHAQTYKQENTPKYNTIDIAIWRAQYHKCPLILASATPSIESYTRAQMDIYSLLEMKKPINNLQKDIAIIDMKDEMKQGNRYVSDALMKKIKDRIKKGEQVMLFLNRRGYTTTVVCRDCGEVVKCPNCEISLTYHKVSKALKCHYCHYENNLRVKCQKCGGEYRHFGLGTQKLMEEITKKIDAKVVRMDADATKKRGSHQQIINDFIAHKYDILIGTQMIAKGLDFANVTLVGVISGDAGLNAPDFRSAERTFQLINQVAGRSGRLNKKGCVVVQCFNPEHYSIRYACPRCGGQGKTFAKTCNKCNGSGKTRIQKKVEIKIPAGVDAGNQLRMSGLGDVGINNGPNGDLYIEFLVAPHSLFKREGNDIFLELPITISEAALGAKKEVPTLEGSVKLTIPSGSQSGDKHRLKNKGVKSVNSYGKGDMYVILKIIVPKKLNKEEKRILQNLAKVEEKKTPDFEKIKKYL